MALTIYGYPDKIDNSASFEVSTTLTEDSTHVNLRVKAELYHEGIIKAVIEKPKGLLVFDFSEILKSLIPGLLFARDSTDLAECGTAGTQLISSWATKSGTYTTLTTSGAEITRAVCTVSSVLESNAIAMTAGELYLFYSSTYLKSNNDIYASLETGGASGTILGRHEGILLMPTTTGNIKINIGNTVNQDFSGIFILQKITTSRTTIGSPLAPYFITFTEVYEDASGVTQTGASSISELYRYVSASTSAFSNYVLIDSNKLFANLTLHASAAWFYTYNPVEYWLMFFTPYVNMELFYSKDGGAYDHATHFDCYEGWGAVIINIGEIMASVTTYLRVQLGIVGLDKISSVNNIWVQSSQVDERVVLEFDGAAGGKEYLPFEGIKAIDYVSDRSYYKASTNNRKLLKAKNYNRQRLETLFKDQSYTTYLKALLDSETVKRLELAYATPTDVTVVSDSVKISHSELFTNSLEIEY